MSTLTEIEKSADQLPTAEKQKLAWFLLTRLRCEDATGLPSVRDIPKEKIEGWIADDEAAYKEFLAGK